VTRLLCFVFDHRLLPLAPWFVCSRCDYYTRAGWR
jgi:hypothetical protein